MVTKGKSRGLTRMESQPDPDVECHGEGRRTVNMRPSEPPNLEDCDCYDNLQKEATSVGGHDDGRTPKQIQVQEWLGGEILG